MIGIDIIDLRDPLLNKRSDRTLQLIACEQDRNIDHPHLFWLLWTAKEAVFKAKREIIPFDPRKVPIELKEADGQIIFRSGEFRGSFELFESHVMAVASSGKTQIKWKVFREETNDWSSLIRKKIVDQLQATGTDLTLTNDESSLPTLMPGNIPVSFSHHGKFGSFAYQATLRHEEI